MERVDFKEEKKVGEMINTQTVEVRVRGRGG